MGAQLALGLGDSHSSRGRHAETIEERGVREWSTIVVIVILFIGAVLIPVTVQKFRYTFRPLLRLYRDADWAGAAGKGKGQVHPNDSVGA